MQAGISTIMAALLLSMALTPLQAEVFTLWPWSGKGEAQARVETIPGFSEQDALTEPIEINGVPLELRISRVNGSFSEVLTALLLRFKPENLQVFSDTVRVTYPLPGGELDRWLLVDSGPGSPVTVFRLTTPATMPGDVPWPHELPAPPAGTRVDQVIRFAKRGSCYVSFHYEDQSPEYLLGQYTATLAAAGWQPVGHEAAPGQNGTGDLFLRTDPRALLWLSFHEQQGIMRLAPIGQP